MTFVPALEMLVAMIGRLDSTMAVVKGIDLDAAEMWLRPVNGGTRYAAAISDRWVEVHTNRVSEVWFLAGPPGSGSAWSRPYFTQAGANAAVDASTILMLHVLPDGSTTFAIMV